MSYAAGSGTYSISVADVDADGDKDIAVANMDGNDVSILKNNGDGTYALPVNYAIGTWPFSVIAADLDGDGDQDLAVAYSGLDDGPGGVSVLKNEGDGTYGAPVNYVSRKYSYSICCADLDGDDDQDLAVASGYDGVAILRNNGDATYTSPITFSGGGDSRSIHSSDLDGDGNADLAVATGINVSVLINCAVIPPPLMQLDILPGSCPNVINTGVHEIEYRNIHPGAAAANKPQVKVAILGSKAFAVTRIDQTSVTLGGLSPVSATLADVSRPVESRETDCECATVRADGFEDLVLSFYQTQLVAVLGSFVDGEQQSVSLAGITKDGFQLEGSDCLTITTRPIRVGFLAGVDEQIPSGLDDCSPNPFNAATTITYSLSSDEHVRLEIYNILGQHVTTLVDAELPAGSHEVVWDAQGIASGVYFARLNTRGGSQSKKMVVMK